MLNSTEDLGLKGDGVEPKRIRRLDNAVEKWRSIVADRLALTEKEVEARDKCVEIMHQEGLKTYRYWDSDDDQKDLVLIGAEKLKLQKINDVVEASETDVDAD